MLYCKKCGAELNNKSFCQNCGAAVGGNSFDKYLQGDDHTPDFSQDDIQQNRVYAILGYFGILVLVPLLGAKNSPFARFHARQSLILLLVNIVGRTLLFILQAIAYFKVLQVLLFLINGVLAIALFAATIMGIIYAAQGKAKDVPGMNLFKKFRI